MRPCDRSSCGANLFSGDTTEGCKYALAVSQRTLDQEALPDSGDSLAINLKAPHILLTYIYPAHTLGLAHRLLEGDSNYLLGMDERWLISYPRPGWNIMSRTR